MIPSVKLVVVSNYTAFTLSIIDTLQLLWMCVYISIINSTVTFRVHD